MLESEHAIAESYVNLIPTTEGGTHVNGLRVGAAGCGAGVLRIPGTWSRADSEAHARRRLGRRELRAVRENARRRNSPAKPRKNCRRANPLGIVQGVIKDAFALWLQLSIPIQGEKIAMLAIANAQQRFKDSQKVARKRIVAGPANRRVNSSRLRQPGVPARSELIRAGRGRFGWRQARPGWRAIRGNAGHLMPLRVKSCRPVGKDRRSTLCDTRVPQRSALRSALIWPLA